MNSKQFQKYLDRDGVCAHCGTSEGLVPHHRKNRGMGGSKERNVPSNIIVMCYAFNGLMESNSTSAKMAIEFGWKLTAGQDPYETPVYQNGDWYLLDDKFGKLRLTVLMRDDD